MCATMAARQHIANFPHGSFARFDKSLHFRHRAWKRRHHSTPSPSLSASPVRAGSPRSAESMRCSSLLSNAFGGTYEDLEKPLSLTRPLKVTVCETCEARVRIPGGKPARRATFNAHYPRGAGPFLSLYVILSAPERVLDTSMCFVTNLPRAISCLAKSLSNSW